MLSIARTRIIVLNGFGLTGLSPAVLVFFFVENLKMKYNKRLTLTTI